MSNLINQPLPDCFTYLFFLTKIYPKITFDAPYPYDKSLYFQKNFGIVVKSPQGGKKSNRQRLTVQQNHKIDEGSVLIMEYEDRVSRVLCRIARRLGMNPVASHNYNEFKTLYDTSHPRIILLSLDTPTNNQSEILQYLVERRTPATIVLLSNMDEEKLLGFERNGRNAGLNMGGILRKPMDLTAIQSKLEDLISPDQGNSFKKKVLSAGIELAMHEIACKTAVITYNHENFTDFQLLT